MKNILNLLLIGGIFLSGCGNGENSTPPEQNIAETEAMAQELQDAVEEAMENQEVYEGEMEVEPEKILIREESDLYGYYVGMFGAKEYDHTKNYTGANKINISIDAISGGKIQGHSVVAGNNRPFSGTIEEENGEFHVIASEPGDDKYDGTFTFTVEPDGDLRGTWEANDKNLPVTVREYDLEKTEYTYNPEAMTLESVGYTELYNTYNKALDMEEYLTEDVQRFNASTELLKKEDIENMYKGDLEVIRNSIYARHGYSFKNRKMRYVFNYVDWYIPLSTDIRSKLTDLEKKNIDLLKRYEQHAEKYYDSFGR